MYDIILTIEFGISEMTLRIVKLPRLTEIASRESDATGIKIIGA